MKLGKLLAAGKSIMSGRTDISYRSSKQVYLPKFGPAKNPFKPESASSPEEAASEDPAHDPQRSPMQAVQPTTALGSVMVPLAKPGPVRVDGLGEESAACADTAAIAQTLPPLPGMKKKAGWMVKFNPSSIFRTAPSGADAKGQKPTPTQAELSLDSVRVVHNDLSDVDVEVVPIKSRASAPKEKSTKKSLDILGERLFGVEPT